MFPHCCAEMADRVNRHCDRHDDPSSCPDALISYTPRFREYALIVHDGGTSGVGIAFCPWCGRRLPESLRDRWFDELERLGVDPWEDRVPPEFEEDRWFTAPGEGFTAPGEGFGAPGENHLPPREHQP
ncbi:MULTISPECIES: DUF6980 family protein [unclassified Streptomyces]|uniref:DUF6980 family protein n=1 Tax=unclassified Streptomyces TaxID=2593676 RepID=UPI00093E184B|nr:hypothetical protein [Streptomyces sp. TSRI0107]